jgi:hypothetical protein
MYRRGAGTKLVGHRIGKLHDLERRLGIVDEPTSAQAALMAGQSERGVGWDGSGARHLRRDVARSRR